MNTLYKNLIDKLIILIGIVVFAYLFNFILYLFLPHNKPINFQYNDESLEFVRYNFKNAINDINVSSEIIKPKQNVKKVEYSLLSNILLLAIIDLGNEQGFITIQPRGNNKTYILGINDDYKDYVLKSVFKDHAIFVKNKKEYKIMLKNTKLPVFNFESTQNIIDTNSGSIKKINNNDYQITRKILDSYIKDFNNIWREISIVENTIDGRTNGYKITNVRKKSVFEKLGLNKGDIIREVNNIPLKNHRDAFKIYGQIGKMKSIQLKIMRRGSDVEINYEIN